MYVLILLDHQIFGRIVEADTAVFGPGHAVLPLIVE